MASTDRTSSSDAAARLDQVLASDRTDPGALGEDLFAVSALLAGSVPLRRALTDPSRSPRDRAALATGLLRSEISPAAVVIVSDVVSARWSGPYELVDAIESLAVQATVASAERAGRAEGVEDDLFRFRRIVDGDPELRRALTDPATTPQRRDALLQDLLGERVPPESRRLIGQAFSRPRGRGYDSVLDDYVRAAAARRGRLVARVTSAVALTATQRERMAAGLQRLYGKPVHLDLDIDPAVVGGLRVQVGDEVMDGTLSTRLDDAARRIAG